MPGIAWDGRGIGQTRIAHPDPDQAVALGDGKAADPGALRDQRLARDFDAVSAAIENHAVIFAADVVSEHLSAGQGHAAVATAVFQRDNLTIGLPIEHDGLFEQGPRKRTFADFRPPGRHIPSVIEKHCYPP